MLLLSLSIVEKLFVLSHLVVSVALELFALVFLPVLLVFVEHLKIFVNPLQLKGYPVVLLKVYFVVLFV